MVEVAALFRRHGPADRAQGTDRVLPSHLAALAARARCRTAALGGPLSQCTACGDLASSSPACTNRPCPTGQHDAAPRGLAPQRALLLPVPYVLVPLTRPEALRPVARAHQRGLSTLRVQTSAAAVQALTLDAHALGGQSGLVGVLHPWTRDLASPPHGHALVPGGALSPEGSQGRAPRSEAWRVPVRALSTRCRGQCKAARTSAGRCDPVPPQGWTQAWGTHGTPAGPGTAVLTSFAPSISRRALTTHRLETLADGSVTVRCTKRRAPGGHAARCPPPRVSTAASSMGCHAGASPCAPTASCVRAVATCSRSCGRSWRPAPATPLLRSAAPTGPGGGPTRPAMRRATRLPGASIASHKRPAVMTARGDRPRGLGSMAPWRSTRRARPWSQRLTGARWAAHEQSVAAGRHARPPRAHAALQDGLDAGMRPRSFPLRSPCTALRSPSAALPTHGKATGHDASPWACSTQHGVAAPHHTNA